VPTLYWMSVTVHLLAALVWLGGMFFLALVGAPVLRKVEPPEFRSRLFNDLGERARTAGWVSIGILIATGLLNLHYRGLLSWSVLGSETFWFGPMGRALSWKLAAVLVMLVASAVHDFILGPRAGTLPPGSPERERARRWSALLARGNAVVGVLLVYWAVRLARGG
jgi:copper resistance protein D